VSSDYQLATEKLGIREREIGGKKNQLIIRGLTAPGYAPAWSIQ
jgi:hypothetical protein